MDHLRVAEIYASHGSVGSYGSGYLIAPGLVLTALHVVASACAGGKCELRFIGDVILERADWRAYDVVWQHATLDLALLRAGKRSLAYAGGPSTLVRMSVLPRSEDKPSCTAVGFPRVMRHDGRNQTQEISGVVLTKSLLEAGQWQVVVTFGAAPKVDDDWKGVSGTALFCADRLVGVITDAESRFRQGVLVAQPIDPLCDDEDFLHQLNLSRDAAFEVYDTTRDAKPWDELLKLAYLVDRKIPFDELSAAVKRTLGTKDAPRTLACAVPGDVEHEHIDLIELFRKEWLPSMFAGRHGFNDIVSGDWPLQAESVRNGLQQLRTPIHSMLGIAEASAEDSARRITGALNRSAGPRVFSWEIRESMFSPLQRDLLQAWLDEWAKVEAAGLNDMVTLFFCLVFDRPAAPPAPWWKFQRMAALASLRDFVRDAFDPLDDIRDRHGPRRVRLSDLAHCERRRHLSEWGDKLEARPRDRWLARDGHVTTVRMKIKQDLFTMRTLLQTLDDLKEPQRAGAAR